MDQGSRDAARRGQGPRRVRLARKKTAKGTLEFYALRHGYISRINDQGASAKETQELARNSTPMLTIGTYTHAEEAKFFDIVHKSMPDLSSERIRKALRLSGDVSTLEALKDGQSTKGRVGQ